jgi:hypothetical protein
MQNSFEIIEQFKDKEKLNSSIEHLKLFYSTVKSIFSLDNYKDLYYYSIQLITNPSYKYIFARSYREFINVKKSNLPKSWLDVEIDKLRMEFIKSKPPKRKKNKKKKSKFKISAVGAFSKGKVKNIRNSNRPSLSSKGLNRKVISIAKRN